MESSYSGSTDFLVSMAFFPPFNYSPVNLNPFSL